MSRLGPVRRSLLAVGAALTVGLTGVLAVPTWADPGGAPGNPNPNSDRARPDGRDKSSAIVQLSRDPLATDAAATRRGGLDLRSPAAQDARAKLAHQRNAYRNWLKKNAPAAAVTGEFDVAVNALAVRLNGTPLEELTGGPGVVNVSHQATYSPAAEREDPDLSLVKAMQAWDGTNASADPRNQGQGIKVGIIDTGIDQEHPCFADAGYPDQAELGDTRFTNEKVIVARVFADKAKQYGYTAEAVQPHGTHVAGVVACNESTRAEIDGTGVPYRPSGVAPRALLGNYNVFPSVLEDARTENILDALQAAAEDGMDVVNLSLGGGATGVRDLLTKAVDNLDRAGIVVTAAAGNDGPGHSTVGSPGSAQRALTAGASSVGHYLGVPVSGESGRAVTVAAKGDFPLPGRALTGTLVAAKGGSEELPIGDACTRSADSGRTVGAVLLAARGSCTFGTKVANAQLSGAKAVIIVNNVPGDPVAMAIDPAFPSTIPAVMAPLRDLQKLRARIDTTVRLAATTAYVDSDNDNIMGNFSGEGPTDVDFRVKPDLVAPGVNVLSSVPVSGCKPATGAGCWAFMQGTSMASPHLAGAAAVVRQVHPSWTADQIRSAITNTATESLLRRASSIEAPETDPLVTGAGLLDLAAAVEAKLALSEVSTSFGSTPKGKMRAVNRVLTVTNLTDSTVTVDVDIDGDQWFSSSVNQLVIPAGRSAELTLAFSPRRQAVDGDHTAVLRLGDYAHSVLYGFVS